MGSGIWISGQAEPFKAGLITKDDLFACREDVTKLLSAHGLEESVAFNLVEKLRKGKKLTEEEIGLIRGTTLKKVVVDNILKITYLFPEAHAVSYARDCMRIMWYKQFEPSAFYCALLTQYGREVNDFDYFEVFNCNTLEELKQIEKKYSIGKLNGDVTIKFKTRLADLIFEAKLRGFKLVPTNLYSHYSLFIHNPTNDKEIFMPLVSIAGVAELTAKKIYETFKEKKYVSYQDLLERKCEGNRKIFNKTTLQGLGLYELQPEEIEKLDKQMNELNLRMEQKKHE